MQLSVLEVLNSQKSLNILGTKALPAKTSFRIARLLSALEVEVKLAEEHRVKLVEKYGVIDPEKPGTKSVPQDKMEIFGREFSALLQEKVNIDFTPIKLEDLGNIEIAPVDLKNLSVLLSD